MVLVKRIRRRGANIVVEAHGEVLFAPSGDVGRWTNRFSNRVTAATAAAAPTNKRPRWGHYGKPLKSTITSSTTYQPGRMKVYSAVGSSAPHAYYVDQGTGVFAGNGPYEAKVLPPWTRGGASLYESTWRPAGPGGRRVAPVMIRGQKGQFFFDEGLRRGFQSMRMRSFQVPGEGQITKALASLPSGLLNFLGNTPNDSAFRASLEQWRGWRDAAWRGEAGAFGHEGIVRRRNVARVEQLRREKASAAKAGPTNREKYLATKAAAERRKKAQIKALADKKKAAEEGRKRKAAAAAKAANESQMRRARAAAVAFAKGKQGVSGRFFRDPDTGLAVVFRVTWTSKKGKQKHRDFPV